jgi:predicted metal-binding membrane protein
VSDASPFGPRPAPVIAVVVIGGAWAVILAAQFAAVDVLIQHDALADEASPPWGTLLVLVVTWQLMIAAMMLPSALPLLALFDAASAGQFRPATLRAAVIAGYASVWTVFGAAALAGDLAVHRTVEGWPALSAHADLLTGAVLLVAGLFQFSALKTRCLTVCRHPGAFILSHYRRGTAGAFRLGAGHGLFCVGCCWALMLVTFALGAASLVVMAAVTALMVVEKTAKRGARVTAPAGLALIALGVLAVVHG